MVKCTKTSPKMVNPRDIAENAEEKELPGIKPQAFHTGDAFYPNRLVTGRNVV